MIQPIEYTEITLSINEVNIFQSLIVLARKLEVAE